MRKRYRRLTPYGGNYIETYLHMTPAMVRSYMRQRGLLDQGVYDIFIENRKNNLKLYRGYIGIKYISYNQETKRMYVTTGLQKPKDIYNYNYELQY